MQLSLKARPATCRRAMFVLLYPNLSDRLDSICKLDRLLFVE